MAAEDYNENQEDYCPVMTRKGLDKKRSHCHIERE
jgi:hypothetical protein